MPPYARVATLALTVTTFAAACGSGASADNAEPTTYASGLTHVAALAFDDDGRLWASTAGYDDTGDDAVYVIAHEGAAAVAVITDAHSPLGLVWHEDSLYVAFDRRRHRLRRLRRHALRDAGHDSHLSRGDRASRQSRGRLQRAVPPRDLGSV